MINRPPFMYIAREFTRAVRGGTVRVMLYGAYNAFGLIGPEMNGIAVVNESIRQIVLDQYRCKNPGWYVGFGGPSEEQLEVMGQLEQLSDQEFLLFARSCPRYRKGSL